MKELIAALMIVESGGRPDAVGDNGKAIGILQIHYEVIVDVNELGYSFKMVDAFDPVKAENICRLYLEHWCGPWATRETLARNWNGGPTGPRKKATLKYWRKVHKELKRRKRGTHSP